jgi:hypothetical protein
MSTADTKRKSSILICYLCAIQAVGAFLATAVWFEGISDHTEAGGWFRLIFIWGIAPWLGATIVLAGILPSALLYFRDHHRLDLISFRISSITLGVITAETVFLKLGGFMEQ